MAAVVNANLRKRVDALIAYGEQHGWTMRAQEDGDYDTEGCSEVVPVGGMYPLTNGRDFVFVMALAVNADSGRVVTLQLPDQHDARVTVELHGDHTHRITGTPRYWYSTRATAWRDALRDPREWCDYTD